MNTKIQQGLSLDKEERKTVLDMYRALEKADSDINYIYSGYRDGSLLINNYTPPKGFNSVVRPWYQAALKTSPDISGGVPYRDINNKEWLVSIGKTLMAGDQITGVVAIDASIDTVADLLKKGSEKYESSYSFIVNTQGEIIIHKKKSLLFKKISEAINSPVDFDEPEGSFEYRFDNLRKLACYSRIDNLGWIVVTVVNKSEIVRPIVGQIAVIILIVSTMAVLLGWAFSVVLSRRFIAPLVELKKRVNSIITGSLDDSGEYQYPKNEIGAMAADIEKLTESELYARNIELKTMNEKLDVLSTTDQLTKLFNRRKMNSEIEKELKRSIRYKSKFSIIMFDIDWFKKINDTYGHQAGDSVLEELSALLKATLRSTDIISRWGGEEFLILCPEAGLKAAEGLAEKLLSAVENNPFTIGVRVTISAGVCEFTESKNLEELLGKVDGKLYEAKRRGRNIVVA